MKSKILLIALLWVTTSQAQDKRTFSISMIAGTDFGAAYTTLGVETGFYGLKTKHSFLITLEADRIGNELLLKYQRPGKIWDGTLSRSSHVTTLKYTYRFLRYDVASLSGVIQPWRSWNMGINSLYIGGRLTFKIKRDNISVEFLNDPIVNRNTLRLVFTPIFL